MFPNLIPEARARLRQFLARETAVTLRWVTFADGAAVDATTGAVLGERTAHTRTTTGHVHHVRPTESLARQMAEIQAGDVILNLLDDEEVAGLAELTFTFDGATWVEKKIPDVTKRRLSGVIEEGVRLYQTLVVQLQR